MWPEALLSDTNRAFPEKLRVTRDTRAQGRFSGCRKVGGEQRSQGPKPEPRVSGSRACRGSAFGSPREGEAEGTAERLMGWGAVLPGCQTRALGGAFTKGLERPTVAQGRRGGKKSPQMETY